MEPKPTSDTPSPSIKRPLDETLETMSISKRQCTSAPISETPSLISKESLLNFPIPDRPGKSCHVKLYDDIESVKLNDMVEVVGFLSVNPSLAGSEDDDEDAMVVQTHNPPPSLIPRMHCVHWRRVAYYNPLCDEELGVEEMRYLKKELHILLSQILLGDGVAAEYLIYHLLSDV